LEKYDKKPNLFNPLNRSICWDMMGIAYTSDKVFPWRDHSPKPVEGLDDAMRVLALIGINSWDIGRMVVAELRACGLGVGRAEVLAAAVLLGMVGKEDLLERGLLRRTGFEHMGEGLVTTREFNQALEMLRLCREAIRASSTVLCPRCLGHRLNRWGCLRYRCKECGRVFKASSLPPFVRDRGWAMLFAKALVMAEAERRRRRRSGGPRAGAEIPGRVLEMLCSRPGVRRGRLSTKQIYRYMRYLKKAVLVNRLGLEAIQLSPCKG